MRRLRYWHLDDVPQPFLTYRRIAFSVIVFLFLAACGDGLLLGYDAINHRSPLGALVTYGAIAVVGMAFGGLFGWTNQKSPRWQEWHKSRKTLTPGWPDGDRR